LLGSGKDLRKEEVYGRSWPPHKTMLLLGWESCILVNTQIISPDFTLQAETSQLEGLNTIAVITEPQTTSWWFFYCL